METNKRGGWTSNSRELNVSLHRCWFLPENTRSHVDNTPAMHQVAEVETEGEEAKPAAQNLTEEINDHQNVEGLTFLKGRPRPYMK